MVLPATKARVVFNREKDGKQFALDLKSGELRVRKIQLPSLANEKTLRGLLVGDSDLHNFCWRVLARILCYSASLLPDVTHSPQDIDDAMKLGYNWVQGPFEMLDDIGVEWFVSRLKSEDMEVPKYLASLGKNSVYQVSENALQVRHWDGEYKDIQLPENVVRFSMMRRTLEPVMENAGASLFHLKDGVRLVEFHTKANALDEDCMAIVTAAASDPGPGIIVHNDAQHFSAGVNLERFRELILAKNWNGIDVFLQSFQNAVRDLMYCSAPVVGAPSGLAIGGGYEVLAHCDQVVAHTNSVMGLVEATVGLVPGGGGVKETYLRWYQSTGDWEKAAWKTFNQIGYGQTASSPALAAKMRYFISGRDGQVMNRDRLVSASLSAINEMRENYEPRALPVFKLAGGKVYRDMVDFLEKGKVQGIFFEHDVRVASAIAEIVTGGENGETDEISEQQMFAFEREQFIKLAQTQQTLARIEAMLSGKGMIRN